MAEGHGPYPWPWAMALGHGHGPWPLAMAKGHGHGPWAGCLLYPQTVRRLNETVNCAIISSGDAFLYKQNLTPKRTESLGPWPLAMAKGHGPWPWPKAMALGHGPWPWPLAMALGHGPCPWPMVMAHGHRPWGFGVARAP